jgi:hypothetical protein
MKKSILTVVAAVFLIAMTLYIPKDAEAVPAFARQTGMSCNACHFQHYPLLNQFGRDFKAKGYTMVGGQSLIEGDMLSMPSTLNASLVTKLRWHKTNGGGENGTNKGAFEMPDEAALLLGGRVGEHVGFLLEAQMAEDDTPMWAAYKMPIGFDAGLAHISVTPFSTDAFGPQYAFELLNTGALRTNRVLENRGAVSAVQHMGLQSAAQGLGLAAYHTTGYIAYSAWQPETTKTTSPSGDFLNYARLAATPQLIDGWDIGGGIQWWSGTAKLDDGTTYEKYEAIAVDAQAQGLVGNMPLGVYAQYGSAPESKTNETANSFNGNSDTASAWSLVAELGVLPNRATVALAFLSADDGSTANNKETKSTIGATYLLLQNVELQLNHTWKGGNKYDTPQANGDQDTYLMLFAAF